MDMTDSSQTPGVIYRIPGLPRTKPSPPDSTPFPGEHPAASARRAGFRGDGPEKQRSDSEYVL